MADPDQSGLLNTCPECGVIVDVSSHGPHEKIACPECGTAMRVRTHFNHFIIQRKLGEGGMSRVYRAKDTTLGRDVALKILHPQFTEHAELTNRFEREAQLTALISHPNVVKVYSVGRDQGYFYIAMEFVEGSSLEELIREGKMDESRVLDIGVQVAQGLRAAHQSGLIHRDIKPGNILITKDGMAKIVDFGLALMAESDEDESGVIWATPYYVPPEKLNDELEDARSDIYSLGATMFHSLAGRPPFDVDTTSLDTLRELKENPVSLEDAVSDVSAETCRAVNTMLERKPSDRFADYNALLSALKRARTMLGDSDLREGSKAEPYSQRTIAIAAIFFLTVAGFIVYRALFDRHEAGAPVDGGAQVQEVLVTEQGPSKTTGAARFLEAREFLLAGKASKAAAIFGELIENYEITQPTLNWAIYNAGLSALLNGDRDGGREFFRRLGEEEWSPENPEEQAMADFFAEVSRHMQRELPVMETAIDPAEATDVRAMAWLAYGLKNWQDGRFDEAFTFFEAFRDSMPPKRIEWINSYKGLLADFENDRMLLRKVPKPSSAMSLDEAKAALADFEKLEKKFRVQGSGVNFLEDRRARTRATHDRLERQERERDMERLAAEKLEQEQLRAVEMEAFAELMASLKPLENPAGFEEAIEKLRAAEFKDAEMRKTLADEMRTWNAAAGFTTTLINDLNRYGYSGAIFRRDAAALDGAIVQATAEELRVRIEIGGTSGETTLPFSSISDEGLLNIGRKTLEVIPDEENRRDRYEKFIFFARKTGWQELADSVGAEFALKDEAFADFWNRLPKAMPETNDNHS